MKVNQNDILGGIFIYDEFEYFESKNYAVELTRTDKTFAVLGQAKYNPKTNMLEYTGIRNPDLVPEVCLNTIAEINFTPLTRGVEAA